VKDKFPGFDECMRLMRKHDPQLKEEGFGYLLPRSHDYVDALIAEFQTESDHGARCWLLELIGEARVTAAFPLLLEYLYSTDESLRSWAIRGLQHLNTKEARSALWEAGVHE